MIVIGVWQLPHFWLIVLYHANDYRLSGVPSMLALFSRRQVKRIMFCWVVSFAVLTLLLPVFRVVTSGGAQYLLTINAFVLCFYFGYRCFFHPRAGLLPYRQLFIHLNTALLFVVFLGIVENI